jgi:hypothetical protein
MAATHPRSTTAPTTPHGSFLLRLLEELGSHPSVWDPWLLLNPYHAARRTFARR